MRTMIHTRKASSYLEGSSKVSKMESTSMTVTDLFRIQKQRLDNFCSIAEEISNEMELENDSTSSKKCSDADRLRKDTRSTSTDSGMSSESDQSEQYDSDVCDSILADFYSVNTETVECCDVDDADDFSDKIWASPCSDSVQQRLSSSSTVSGSPSSLYTIDEFPRHHTESHHHLHHQRQRKQQQHQLTCARNNSEIKSGHLVLILSDQSFTSILPTSKRSQASEVSGTISASRLPVIVKIHGKSYERYAIINLTRRRQTLPSIYLKLKRSQVRQVSSNPSRFMVVVDGTEGKSFTFEATNPSTASEWMDAFSPDGFCSQKSPSHQKHFTKSISTESSSSVNSTSSDENSFDISPRPLNVPFSEANIPSPPLKMPRSPVMPVLSESLNEDEESEE